MATKLVTNRGELAIANYIKAWLDGTSPAAPAWELHLIKADFTVADTTIISDLTVSDYSGWSLGTATNTTTSNKGQMDFGSNTWTADATANDIYGYWVQEAADDGTVIPLILVKFTSTKPLNDNGVDQLQINFKLAISSA